MSYPTTRLVACPYCGREHVMPPLRRGERALCADCGARLPRPDASPQATLAFTLAAVILAWPSVQLPLVNVSKFGAERASYLWTGVVALWHDGMPLLSVWVALCGIVVPLALLASLVIHVPAARLAPFRGRRWQRIGRALQHWSMPEVQVLAVLVAFIKIGALVDVQPGPGLWCYAAMTLAMLLAWHAAGAEGSA